MQLKNNKYLITAFLFAAINLAAIFIVFGFRQYGDTGEYLGAIRWFRGDLVQVDPLRFLRPLGPLLATRFEFLGSGAGLIVQNIIFYFLLVFLIFRITEFIFGQKKYAFLASLFFITTTPFIETGLAYLTDAGSWFFYCLSIYLTLLYLRPGNGRSGNGRSGNEKLVSLNGFLSGLGFLLKENGVMGAPFFALMVLFSKKFSFREKLVKIALFSFLFLVLAVGWQFVSFKLFHFTFLDVYFGPGSPGIAGEGFLLVILRYLGQLFRTMGILWPFFFMGLIALWSNRDLERAKIFLALLPSSLSFFAWSAAAGARTTFMFAPLGILLSIYGLSALEKGLSKKRFAIILAFVIIVSVFLNYLFCWFNPKVAFVDALAKLLGL